MLMLRWMLGMSGSRCHQRCAGASAQRTVATDIAVHLDRQKLDIDGDSSVDVVTDGILLLRALLGFSGSSDHRQRAVALRDANHVGKYSQPSGGHLLAAGRTRGRAAIRHDSWARYACCGYALLDAQTSAYAGQANRLAWTRSV